MGVHCSKLFCAIPPASEPDYDPKVYGSQCFVFVLLLQMQPDEILNFIDDKLVYDICRSNHRLRSNCILGAVRRYHQEKNEIEAVHNRKALYVRMLDEFEPIQDQYEREKLSAQCTNICCKKPKYYSGPHLSSRSSTGSWQSCFPIPMNRRPRARVQPQMVYDFQDDVFQQNEDDDNISIQDVSDGSVEELQMLDADDQWNYDDRNASNKSVGTESNHSCLFCFRSRRSYSI